MEIGPGSASWDKDRPPFLLLPRRGRRRRLGFDEDADLLAGEASFADEVVRGDGPAFLGDASAAAMALGGVGPARGK
jgi:hypothetical protein